MRAATKQQLAALGANVASAVTAAEILQSAAKSACD